MLTAVPIVITDVPHTARIPDGLRLVSQYPDLIHQHQDAVLSMLVTQDPMTWRTLGWIAFSGAYNAMRVTSTGLPEKLVTGALQDALDALSDSVVAHPAHYLYGARVHWIVQKPDLHVYARRADPSGRACLPGGIQVGQIRLFRNNDLFHAQHKSLRICTHADLGTVFLQALSWGAASRHQYFALVQALMPHMDQVLHDMRHEMPA